MMRKSFAIASGLLLLFGSGIARAETIEEGEKRILSQFEGMRSQIQQVTTAPAACEDVANAIGSGKECSFGGICSQLSANRDSAYIYKNSAGETLPNYHIFDLERMVSSCALKEIDNFKKSRPDWNPQAEVDQRDRALRVARIKAYQTYIDLMTAKHQAALFVELESAMNKAELDNVTHAKQMADLVEQAVPTRDEITKKVDAYLAAAGAKKIDPELKEAFLQYVLTYATPFQAQVPPLDWKPIFRDPFINTAAFYDQRFAGSKEQVEANQKLYQAEVDRSVALFHDLQSQMVAEIDKLNPDKNSPVGAMAERIKSIGIQALALEPQSLGACPGPNAFYLPSLHSFFICPQFMRIPKETQKTIMAHELRHSVDPCTLGFPLIHITGELRQEGSEKLKENALKAAAQQGLFFYEPKLPKKLEFTDVNMVGEPTQLTQALGGQLKGIVASEVAPATPGDQHPDARTVACLAGADSVGAHAASEDEQRKKLTTALEQLKGQGNTAANNPLIAQMEQTLAHLPEIMKASGACSSIPGEAHSQVQEAYADQGAIRTVLDDIRAAKKPEKKREIAFEAVLGLVATSCGSLVPTIQTKIVQQLTQMSCFDKGQDFSAALNSMNVASHLNADEHPEDVNRVNRLWLAQPEISGALGCTPPQGVKACE